VARAGAPGWCRQVTLVIGPQELKTQGVHALTRRPDGGFDVRTGFGDAGRPWRAGRSVD
jgi:hypothetical protein